jgi:hypothetical protein
MSGRLTTRKPQAGKQHWQGRAGQHSGKSACEDEVAVLEAEGVRAGFVVSCIW